MPIISLHELTTGIDGDTMEIPPTPPTSGDGGGFVIPPIRIPPIPPFPIPTIGGGQLTFVPALGATPNGWLEPTAISDFHGVRLSAASIQTAYGTFVTSPTITESSLTIYAIVDTLSGAGSGNIKCRNYLSWGGIENGEWFPYSELTEETVDLGATNPDVRLLAPVTIPNTGQVLTGQQIFQIQFRRSGSDPADTYGIDVVIYGWYLTWL